MVNPANDSARTMRIDFHLDLICPWCWIGMRHLFAACKVLRADQPELVIDVHWHAATLLPQIPEQGVPYQTFYVNRLGSAAAVAARREQVQASASTVGLTLNFEAIEMFPNTGLVCAMVNLAQEQLDAQAMYFFVESIFAAYFMHGKDIGSLSTLRELADAAGLMLDMDRLSAERSQPAPGLHTGVPHIVVDRRWSTTGAVPAVELLSMMARSLASRAADV